MLYCKQICCIVLSASINVAPGQVCGVVDVVALLEESDDPFGGLVSTYCAHASLTGA